MPDIANYAYLWYKTEDPFDYLSQDEYYGIYEIVTTFSYPCYLSGGLAIDRLLPVQKEYLLKDEIGFIRARMFERGIKPDNITIIQIPRVLYDLFLLVYYTQTQKMRKDILINCGSQPGVATSSDLFGNFEKYKTRIARYLETYTNDILELNHFIIHKIYYIVRGKDPKESYDNTSGSRRVQRPGLASEFDEGDMSPTTFQAQKSTQQFLTDKSKKKAKKKAKKNAKKKTTQVLLDPSTPSSFGTPSSSSSSDSSDSSDSDYSSLESSSASSAPETEPQSPFVVLSPKGKVGTLGEPAWLPWEEPPSPLAGVAGVAQWPKFESWDSPDSPYGDSAPSVMSTMTESQPEVIIAFLQKLESGDKESFQIILEHILHAEYMLMNPHDLSFDTFRLNFTEPVKQIFRVVLQYELQSTPGVTILYRGAVLANDSLLTREGLMQSISFSSSVLSGCINDATACTLFYFEQTASFEAIGKQTGAAKNDKIICRLEKFFKGDGSNGDELFFVPPIPPFLVSMSEGELFHPRTKFNLAYLMSPAYPVSSYKDGNRIKIVNGIFCPSDFLINCDYLHSTKTMEELVILYSYFKSEFIIKLEVSQGGTYRGLTKKYHSKAGRRRTNKTNKITKRAIRRTYKLRTNKIIKRANRRTYKSRTNKIMKRAKRRTYKSRTNKY